MISAYILALGTFGPAAPVPERIDADCVKPSQVAKVTHPHKPRTIVRHRPRIFKTEPKEEAPCQEAEPRLPPSAELPPAEPEAPFSPVPIVPVDEFPPLVVTPLPDEPPSFEVVCACGSPVPVFFPGPPGLLIVPRAPSLPPLPAVPEPSTWALLGAGLLLTRAANKWWWK